MWWRWQQADGRMHAYDRTAVTVGPHRPFLALCGATVTPIDTDFGVTGWPQTTCWSCDHEVRVRDGFPIAEIPPLPDDTPPTPRSPSDGPSRPTRPPRPRQRR
ncbi:zinc finger protein [Saccharomonospora saliphila]|uniref:zinc finger protein n=1 Tax=Saccharomonospora saliphila TaxID=369829 RepID=UPI0009FBB971